MKRRNQNIWKRQAYSWLLMAAVGMGSLPVAKVQADETGDTAMGRYIESEVTLPEEAQVQDIVRMTDGRLRIVGMSMDTSEAGSWKLEALGQYGRWRDMGGSGEAARGIQ